MFFHSNSGVLKTVIGDPPTPFPRNSGFAFTNLEAMYITPWDPAAPLPADTVYWGGFARTSKGSLYVTEGTPSATEKSLSVPARTINGICFVTSGAVGSGSTFTSPWGMVSSIGQVHIDLAFGLGFADLGAGVVSLVAGVSGATPTFTRATTATTVLRNGLIGSVASGAARSYYDPTSLAYLGYLAEGARTNLLLQSADMTNASWTKTDTTPTLSGTGPDGVVNSANLLTEGSAGTALVSQAVTATADVNYAVTRWFKFGNTQWVRLRASNGANAADVFFDIQNGVVGASAVAGTATVVSKSIKAYPNGWYRAEVVGTVGSGATAILSATNSATADGNATRVANSTRLEWGAQFENNVAFASSYIPTTVSTVTRNADVLTYPLTLAAAYTWFISGNAPQAAAATFPTMLATGGDAGIFFIDGSTRRLGSNAGGATFSITLSANTYAAGASFKAAVAIATNDGAGTDGGSVPVTDATVTPTTGAVTVTVGQQAGGTNPWFGTISSIAAYAVRQPNTFLVAATT